MAPLPTMEEQVCLRLLVDEKKNKVLVAEAGKDFVDVLLSFLTLPLGTIARLVSTESNLKKVSFGSLTSLYESVANIDEKLFCTATCKQMLLRPRNSMEGFCQNMKLDIDDTEKTEYFICENWECSRNASGRLFSTFRNQRCKCGRPTNRQIYHRDSSANGRTGEEGFVQKTPTFIITDDLSVKPDNLQSCFCLPTNLGYTDFDAIKLVTVNVTQKEIIDILKWSLISKTPLTDVLLLKKQLLENIVQPIAVSDFDIGSLEANGGSGSLMMKVKLVLRKSSNTILFALGEEDFADFILSFLTFPLGGVENMLNGNTCLGSIDNLYKSILDLDCNTYLTSPDIKDKLVKTPLSYLEPQSSTGKKTYSECGERGFIKGKGLSLYMVTDDLVVTQSSSLSAVSFLSKLRIPPSDLEERIIIIGKNEGLSLLKASLTSSSAMTIGLRPFFKGVFVCLKEGERKETGRMIIGKPF